MGPKSTIQILESVVPTGQPVFLWGPPGVGKSDIMKAVAKALKVLLVDIRAVLFDPVDLRGIPTVRDGKAHWCSPAFLPTEGEGILFLDELPQAAPLVQASLLQLTLDRRIGEYKLPDGWHIVAAGNRAEDRAGGHRLITPILNRFLHVDVDVDNDDWHEWAIENNVASVIRTFIRARPKLLHDFDPAAMQRAFPSPRSWSFASRVLPTCNDTTMHAIISGCVGDGAAAEFVGFFRTYNAIPNLDDLLKSPDKAPVPNDAPDVLTAICGALTERARKKAPAELNAIARYARRLNSEFSAMLIRDAKVASDNLIVKQPEGVQWMKENRSLVLELFGAR